MTGARGTGTDRFSIRDVVPLVGQLRGYSKHALGGDGVAALAVAATLVPQGLAYGQVAGLAPAAGLYTVVGAALVFSLVTSTRFVVVGPSSTLAVMTFEAVRGPAAGDPAKAAALAGCLSIFVGLLCVASPLLRMQRIADLLSGPVMLGYLAGSAVVIFAGQLGVLIGVPAKGEGALAKLGYVITHLGQAHAMTAVVGLGAVAALLLLKRHPTRLPGSLVVLAAAVVASAVFHLAGRGVAVVGAVTGGLPMPGIPAVSGAEALALFPAAGGLALIAIVETVTAIRKTADPGAGPLSLTRESAALGAASVASGVLGGFAPMGNASKGLSARGAGAHSQLFQLGTVAIVLFVLVTGGPTIAMLPLAALAATIVALGVPRLIDVQGFLRLWRGWRAEAGIALVTAACVVVLGVLHGVLVAVLLAAGQMLYRTAHPHDAVLAVTSPDEPAHEVDEHELPRTDVLIYRVDAPLFFANIGRVTDRIRNLAAACGPNLRYLILDVESVFYLDASAADKIAELTLELRERGCEVLLARVRKPVLAPLQANPYHGGATRDLPTFPSVRQAYTHAHEKLQARREDGGKDAQSAAPGPME
ncbi:MAG: sulfate permease, SulP family [Pseudonocardiales bacterium]|nr:sulfate permease, SulP family [Pseudonocardiales bacterium]